MFSSIKVTMSASATVCDPIFKEYHRTSAGPVSLLPHQRDFAHAIKQDMKRWRRKGSPPQHGMIAFHAVGSGKTLAQLAAIAQVKETFPEALILIVSKESALRKNISEMSEDAAAILKRNHDSGDYTNTTMTTHSVLPRTAVSVNKPNAFATPAAMSAELKKKSAIRWPEPARVANDRTGLHFIDTSLSVKFFGSIVSGPSAGLPRVVATTSIALGNELYRATPHKFYGARPVVDLFSRPVVIMMDEVQELFQLDEDKQANVNKNALGSLRKYMTEQQSNLYNIVFTGTLGSSASDIVDLCRLTATRSEQRSVQTSLNKYKGGLITLETFAREWSTVCGRMIHAFSVLRDHHLYPQIEVVPSFDVLHATDFQDVVTNAPKELTVCKDLHSIATGDADLTARITAVFELEIRKNQTRIQKYGQALIEAYQTCVLGEASNPRCYETIVDRHCRLSRNNTKFRNAIKRLRGAVMYFNTFTAYRMPGAPETYASFLKIPMSGSADDLVKNYAFSKQLFRLNKSIPPESNAESLRYVFARMATGDLLKASPKLQKLVENVVSAARDRRGNQLVACLDMDYYNISDAICGALANSNNTGTLNFKPFHVDLVSLCGDMVKKLFDSSEPQDQLVDAIAETLSAQDHIRYADILGLQWVLKKLQINKTVRDLKTTLLDKLYVHKSNTSGQIVHVVVLNSEDLFVGWQGRGTASCHVFDVMKLASVSQFIGRAVRTYPRNNTHHHSLSNAGPVTTCVIVYLSVNNKLSQKSQQGTADDSSHTPEQPYSLNAQNKTVLLTALRRKKREVQQSATSAMRTALLADIEKCVSMLKATPTASKRSSLQAINALGLDISMQQAFIESFQEVLIMSSYALYMSRNCTQTYAMCMHSEYPGHPAGFHPRPDAHHTCGLPPLQNNDADNSDITKPLKTAHSFVRERSLLHALTEMAQYIISSFGKRPVATSVSDAMNAVQDQELYDRLLQIFGR